MAIVKFDPAATASTVAFLEVLDDAKYENQLIMIREYSGSYNEELAKIFQFHHFQITCRKRFEESSTATTAHPIRMKQCL